MACSKTMQYLFFLCLITNALSFDANPAFLWTNKEDYAFPPVYAGQELNAEAFYDTFLRNWVNEGGNIVLILENHLSLDELAQNGDIYDETSTGGKMKNFKSTLDSHVSVEVSSVAAMTNVVSKLKAAVASVKVYQDASSLLQLDAGLTVIDLSKLTNAGNHLVNSDMVIGKVNALISSNPVLVVYTSLGSVKPVVRAASMDSAVLTGRHLLATPDSYNYTFFNLSDCFYFYAKLLTLTVLTNPSDPKSGQSWNLTGSYEVSGVCNKTNASVVVDYIMPITNPNNVPVKVKLTIGATLASLPDSGYWTLTTIDVLYNSTTSSLGASVIYAPLDFCYHCSLPDALTDANRSVSLAIVELQAQHWITGGSFGYASDCIGFFSIPILSALFVMAILLAILTFGLTLVANITTMDRFDDPKGKTISVNVSD